MPRIEVTGNYTRGRGSAQQQMQDMLRYDNGTIERVEEEPSGRYFTKFKAIVISKQYTPDRWTSFGMRTRKLS